MKQARNRRQFLKGAASVLGGALAVRMTGIFPEVQPILAQTIREKTQFQQLAEIDVGEFYEGFLILPDHENIPDFVQYPFKGYPQMCGVGDAPATALTEYPSDFKEFVASSNLPIITVSDVDQHSKDSFMSYIIRYETGELFFALHQLYYEELDALLSFSIQTNFAYPYPVYIFSAVEAGRQSIVPERMDFLPSPGLAVVTETETCLMWIQNDFLYSAQLNRPYNLEQLRTLIHTLEVRSSN